MSGLETMLSWLRTLFWTRDQCARAVVAELSREVGREMSPYGLSKATGLWAGSLYPALVRLEREHRITARWEDRSPYPRRRLYKATPINP